VAGTPATLVVVTPVLETAPEPDGTVTTVLGDVELDPELLHAVAASATISAAVQAGSNDLIGMMCLQKRAMSERNRRYEPTG
jgi:hypothetical protein